MRTPQRRILLSTILTAALGTIAMAQNSGVSSGYPVPKNGFTAQEQRGHGLYRRYCIGCHGPQGDGNGENAPYIDPKPRDFTDCARMKGISDDVAFTAIKEGGEAAHLSKDMPAWKDGMDDGEIHDLIAHIRTFCPN